MVQQIKDILKAVSDMAATGPELITLLTEIRDILKDIRDDKPIAR